MPASGRHVCALGCIHPPALHSRIPKSVPHAPCSPLRASAAIGTRVSESDGTDRWTGLDSPCLRQLHQLVTPPHAPHPTEVVSPRHLGARARGREGDKDLISVELAMAASSRNRPGACRHALLGGMLTRLSRPPVIYISINPTRSSAHPTTHTQHRTLSASPQQLHPEVFLRSTMPQIVVHHLNASRSDRLFWLLEVGRSPHPPHR